MPVDMKWLMQDMLEWEEEQVKIRKRGYYRLRKLDGTDCVVVVDSQGKKIRELNYGKTYNFKIETKTKCTCTCHQTGAKHIIACCSKGYKIIIYEGKGVLQSADNDNNFTFIEYGRKVVVGIKDILNEV